MKQMYCVRIVEPYHWHTLLLGALLSEGQYATYIRATGAEGLEYGEANSV